MREKKVISQPGMSLILILLSSWTGSPSSFPGGQEITCEKKRAKGKIIGGRGDSLPTSSGSCLQVISASSCDLGK